MTAWQRVIVACFAVVSLASFLPHFSAWAAASHARFYFFMISSLLGVVSALASLAFIVLRLLPTTVDAQDLTLKWSRVSWACFLMVVALPCLSSMACGPLPFGSRLRSFNSDLWRAPASRDSTPSAISLRQQMLGAAVSQLLSTADQSRVLAIFGRNELRDEELPFDTDADVGYVSDSCRHGPFVHGPEWLLIWFSNDGSVLRWRIVNARSA